MKPVEREVLIASIRLDGDTQARVNIDADMVDEYAEAMKNGSVFPKIRLIRDTNLRDTYWLIDGFHRVLASRKAKRRKILADVSEGSRDEAQWDALGANKNHGLRRSNEDKAKAARAALRARPHMTDSALATHVGLSSPTIAKYRAEMEDAGTLTLSPNREGADGRTFNAMRMSRLEQIVKAAVRKTSRKLPKHVPCALCNGTGKVRTGH
jgi:ParB-like chromosome segregation protein Spo0J